MKVCIVMGRGIEGCGVTKFTIEQTKWMDKVGHEYHVFASRDKTWTRKNAHDVTNVTQFKFADEAKMNAMIDYANDSDIVIINSLPSISHSDKCVYQFKRFLGAVTSPVVLIQHDHAMMSIRRNAALEDAVKRANVLFGHSDRNDFARYVKEVCGGGSIAAAMGDTTPAKRIRNFQPGMDFDSVRSKYWGELGDPVMHKWIGRTTSWKGYVQMFKFHNEFLRKNGYITTFEGIEKSPAYLGFRELSEFHPMIDKKISDVTFETNQPAYVFGPYINDELLKRLSKCGFGYQLSLLDERFIQRSIEYTHCEVVCTGVVPVLRKSYGERCTHRAFGKKLIDCDNTGTIWLDDNDMEPAYELIRELQSNPNMRDQYREDAYKFYKLHQDSQYTFDEMMTIIKNDLNL